MRGNSSRFTSAFCSSRDSCDGRNMRVHRNERKCRRCRTVRCSVAVVVTPKANTHRLARRGRITSRRLRVALTTGSFLRRSSRASSGILSDTLKRSTALSPLSRYACTRDRMPRVWLLPVTVTWLLPRCQNSLAPKAASNGPFHGSDKTGFMYAADNKLAQRRCRTCLGCCLKSDKN